jgi:Holliday junction resolvase
VSRYRAGYRLERRVERLYTKHGWLATRFPKSGRRIYPADVLAIKKAPNKTIIHLIECKNLSKKDQEKNAIYLRKEQIHRLIEKAGRHNAEAFVAYSFPRQHARIVEASRLRSSGKMVSVERKDGASLKEFLRQVGQTRLLDQ